MCRRSKQKPVKQLFKIRRVQDTFLKHCVWCACTSSTYVVLETVTSSRRLVAAPGCQKKSQSKFHATTSCTTAAAASKKLKRNAKKTCKNKGRPSVYLFSQHLL